MKIRPLVLSYEQELLDIRRALHKMPELSFEEANTSAYIMKYLEKLQPTSLFVCLKTGIKAVFLADGAKKTVAIRADIDALPVCEKNKHDFVSKNNGVMHACGHDGHIAAALITAKIISQAKNRKVNYVFLFQPAEETTGGAKPMVEAGALKNPDVDEIFGIHLWPYTPFGVVESCAGPMMAKMCDINIHVKGRGSHGAKPQDGVDALVCAAHIVSAIQTIVSRSVDPYKTAVITLGTINGGEVRNVICENVLIEGTMRAFDDGVVETMKQRITDILKGADKMFGTKSKYTETMSYRAVVNDEALFLAAKQKFSADEFSVATPVMISEDFSDFQAATKGLFAFLGIQKDETQQPLHSNTFDFDEKALLCGVEYFLRVTDFDENE